MKKYWVTVGLVMSLLGLIGCSKPTKDVSPLSKKEQALMWQEEREKPFGFYDYKELKDEKEAQKLLTEKFKVAVPKSAALFQEALHQSPYFQKQTALGAVYEVIASDTQLLFHQRQQYGANDTVDVVVDSTFTYQMDPEKKQVYLDKQTLLIQDVTPEGSALLYDVFPPMGASLAKSMDFLSIDQAFDTFKKDYQAVDTRKTQEGIPILSNSKEAQKKGLGKSIQVLYDAEGHLREGYVNLSTLVESEE